MYKKFHSWNMNYREEVGGIYIFYTFYNLNHFEHPKTHFI